MRRVPANVVRVSRQRVAGDVEAERLLLLGEALALGPLLFSGDALFRRVRLATTRRGEESELAALAIPLRSRSLREGGLDGVPERLARLLGEIERPRGDQRLDRLAVDLAGVDARAEVEEPGKGLLAGGEDSLDGVFPDSLDGAESETDELLAGRIRTDAERQIGLVHVRGQHGNAVGPRLGDVRHHLVGVVLLRSQERRHELDGMMRLEPGRLVSDQTISRTVTFIETIFRKLFHQIENIVRGFRIDAARRTPGDEP